VNPSVMVFMNRLLLATGNNYDLQYRSTLQFCWINDTKYRIEHDDQLLGEMMQCAYRAIYCLLHHRSPPFVWLLFGFVVV